MLICQNSEGVRGQRKGGNPWSRASRSKETSGKLWYT